jgi:hypothetical protein
MPTVVVMALVYAVAGSDGAPWVGQPLAPHQTVPSGVRGLLFPGRGTVQLADDTSSRLGSVPATIVLEQGELRLQAEAPMTVHTPEVEVTVAPAREAWIRRDQVTLLCAPRGGLSLNWRSQAGGAARRFVVPARTCWVLAGHQAPAQQPFDASALSHLGQLGQSMSPPALAVTEEQVLGSASEQLGELETEWGEAFDQGPRRAAQSCGCSEGGSSSGGLGGGTWGGGTLPQPDRVRPVPGRLRLRIRLPEAP